MCFYHKTEREVSSLVKMCHSTGVCCDESQFGFVHPYLVQCLLRLRAEVHVCRPLVHTAFASKVRPVIVGDASSCGVTFGRTTNA